jgi:hypothetical protein
VLDRAEEHWGPVRAARNLRKFYPWYMEHLGIVGREANAYQRMESLQAVREGLFALQNAGFRTAQERETASL